MHHFERRIGSDGWLVNTFSGERVEDVDDGNDFAERMQVAFVDSEGVTASINTFVMLEYRIVGLFRNDVGFAQNVTTPTGMLLHDLEFGTI